MRIAAIDIGTNSLHMIVVRVRPDLSFEVIDREKEMVRLGAGGLDGRALTPEAMHAALQVLSKFRRLAESHRVDEIVAVATSATREAENGGEFLQAVAAQTGIRPRVISGTEEARLIHLAAVYGVSVPGDVAVVIDIGGGSVEITRGHRRQRRAGPQLQARRHPAHRTVRQERSAGAARRAQAGAAHRRRGRRLSRSDRARRLRPRDRHVGHDPEPRRRRRGRTGTRARTRRCATAASRPSSCAACARSWSPLTLEQRLRVPGLDPRRADLARRRRRPARHDPAAARRRRDHAVRSLAARGAGPRLHRPPSQADRAGRSLSRRPAPQRRSSWPSAATTGRSTPARWRRLAVALFEQTRGIHGLTDREREWLEYAALLHDVGVHISYESHHKHSYYLIKNGDLRGFEPDEIETIALVARYHRRATPKRQHDGYVRSRPPAAPDRPRRSPPSCGWPRASTAATRRSSPASSCTIAAKTRCCRCGRAATPSSSSGPPTRHAAPFERLIGKPLRIEVSGTAYVEQPDEVPTSTRASCSSSRGSTGRARRRSWGCWPSG